MTGEELQNEGFICPITQEIMTDPVIAEDGISYERQAIVNWLKIKKISPITRQRMYGKILPDLELKKKIGIERDKIDSIEKQRKIIEEQLEQIRRIKDEKQRKLIRNYKKKAKILRQPLNRSQSNYVYQQESVCQYLIKRFDNNADDEEKLCVIKSGIADALLNIFLESPLYMITRYYTRAFLQLTYTTSNEIRLLLISKQPYPSLLRLLDHEDDKIVGQIIYSIYNILLSGSQTTPLQTSHPHFRVLTELDGINKIYGMFNRNDALKYSKDNAACCIGRLFRAQEITNTDMKISIINHLKSILLDSNNDLRTITLITLKELAQNASNRTEIEKDGFAIPDK